MNGQTQAAQPQAKSRLFIVIVIVVVLALLGGVYYFLARSKVQPSPAVELPTGAAISNLTLGSEVYEKAANPIGDKLPDTLAPVPNPIEGAYKNPFE